MRLLKTEQVRVLKADGREIGPYPASFGGTTIFIEDERADVEEGDTILRLLPNGKDERSFVTDATLYPGIGRQGGRYHLKFRKGAESTSPLAGHNITISGSQSVQIGNYNSQNITNSLEALVKIIDSSAAPADEKEEAKSLLSRFLAHPIVVAGIGAGVGATVGAAFKS